MTKQIGSYINHKDGRKEKDLLDKRIKELDGCSSLAHFIRTFTIYGDRFLREDHKKMLEIAKTTHDLQPYKTIEIPIDIQYP